MEEIARKTLSHKPSSVSCDLAKMLVLPEVRLIQDVAGDCARAAWGGAVIHLQHWLGQGDPLHHLWPA